MLSNQILPPPVSVPVLVLQKYPCCIIITESVLECIVTPQRHENSKEDSGSIVKQV